MKLTKLVTILVFVFSAQANAQQPNFQETLEKAEAGDSQAQLNIGLMYLLGEGAAENDHESIKWHRFAVEQDATLLLSNLVRMFDDDGNLVTGSLGNDFVGNNQEAAKWFRMAAEQGSALAQSNLGLMYRYGQGVAEDDQEAVKWFRLAAEQGEVYAQFLLGNMYRKGEGVAKNDELAYVWFSVATAQVDDFADIRDQIKAQLTPQALEQAQALATKCFESNYKDCGE